MSLLCEQITPDDMLKYMCLFKVLKMISNAGAVNKHEVNESLHILPIQLK